MRNVDKLPNVVIDGEVFAQHIADEGKVLVPVKGSGELNVLARVLAHAETPELNLLQRGLLFLGGLATLAAITDHLNDTHADALTGHDSGISPVPDDHIGSLGHAGIQSVDEMGLAHAGFVNVAFMQPGPELSGMPSQGLEKYLRGGLDAKMGPDTTATPAFLIDKDILANRDAAAIKRTVSEGFRLSSDAKIGVLTINGGNGIAIVREGKNASMVLCKDESSLFVRCGIMSKKETMTKIPVSIVRVNGVDVLMAEFPVSGGTTKGSMVAKKTEFVPVLNLGPGNVLANWLGKDVVNTGGSIGASISQENLSAVATIVAPGTSSTSFDKAPISGEKLTTKSLAGGLEIKVNANGEVTEFLAPEGTDAAEQAKFLEQFKVAEKLGLPPESLQWKTDGARLWAEDGQGGTMVEWRLDWHKEGYVSYNWQNETTQKAIVNQIEVAPKGVVTADGVAVPVGRDYLMKLRQEGKSEYIRWASGMNGYPLVVTRLNGDTGSIDNTLSVFSPSLGPIAAEDWNDKKIEGVLVCREEGEGEMPGKILIFPLHDYIALDDHVRPQSINK